MSRQLFIYNRLRLFSVVRLAKRFSAHFDFEGIVKKPVAEGIGERGFPHGGVPVFSWELAGEDGGGLTMTILDDFEEVGPFLVGKGRQEDVIDDQDVSLGEFGEELEA